METDKLEELAHVRMCQLSNAAFDDDLMGVVCLAIRRARAVVAIEIAEAFLSEEALQVDSLEKYEGIL